MAVSPEVVDWLACCNYEEDAPKFVNSGVDSINKLRNLPEDQFRKIGLPSWMYDRFLKLKARTSTVEELSQEVSNISLYAACQRGQLDRVELMLENGGADINWHNPYYHGEYTPLIIASSEGHTAVVDLLTTRGAHVNDTDGNDYTALHHCANKGHVETSECLIKHNANVNAVDKLYRRTPAHWAAMNGHLDVLKVLHQHGADLSLRDRKNRTPLDLSREENHTAVTAYLESVANEPALPQPSPSPSPSPPPSPSRQPSAQPSFTSAAGTQNRNLVKKHIEQQGSLPVRSFKAFLIGPSRVGKTTARRRLTEEITNISPDEIVPSTGIEAPLTVELYHPTEQSSVLLSTGWRCQKLEEQCRSLCSRILNSPASSTVLQLDPSSSQSTVTVSPVAARRSRQPLSKLTSLFKRGLKNLIHRSRREETAVQDEAQDELTSALSSLVKNEEWDTVREFLKDVQALTLVNFIDIGGQPEFHEVIPLLLHGLALNLIFLNVTQDLDSPYTVVYRDGKEGSSSIQYESEFTIREIIQRALCTISSLQTTECHKPVAILIGTHIDLTSKAAVLSLDQAIQESFKDADFLKNDVLCRVNKPGEKTRYIHPLDNCSEDSTDIEELRELITRIVHQRFLTEEVPTGALLLQLILRMKFDPRPGWCSVEDCVKIAECCGISREDLLKENGILDYLHDRYGTILFYRKVVGLCLRVIVNANIIMGPPSELFVQAFGAKKGEPMTAEHIRATGEISQRLMNNACKPGNGDSHVKKKKVHKTDDRIPTDEIVALLEYRCVIYKEARSANEDPVYFMPAVLYPDHSVVNESSDPVLLASLHIPPILFIPSTEYAPLGQFSATAVELSKEWELDDTKRYRNRIRFYAKCEGDRLLHVEFRSLSTHLELRVLPQASPQPIDPCLMIESRRMVWKSIAKVASLYSHTRGIRWKLGFYCPQALQLGQHSHPATFKALDNPQEMICSQKGCREGLIALDNKHKCWFTVVTNAITPSAQGVSSVTTPTEQVPVKQDNQSSHPHSGDSVLTTPSTQETVKQTQSDYDQSGDTPTLLEIMTMKATDGRPLRIVETIAASDYKKFGMFLLQDKNGAAVDILKKNHISEGAEAITQSIIKKWLTSGAPTRTYQHLVECLGQSELGALAEEIATNITVASDSNMTTPSTQPVSGVSGLTTVSTQQEPVKQALSHDDQSDILLGRNAPDDKPMISPAVSISTKSSTHQNILDTKPEITTLNCFKYKDNQGRTQRVFITEEIGTSWNRVGLSLNFTASSLDSIESTCHGNVVNCCNRLLILWLEGHVQDVSQAPITWETLLEALRDSRLGQLADKLTDLLTSHED